MKLRRDSGATLALVAGTIIFIIMVAAAFYFLSQLLGGGRELQQATNSGTLNVAKQSIIKRSVTVPAGNPETSDMKEILLGVTPGTQDRVDLLHFNRMVGAAMLVAMNAEADSNQDSATNAQTFIDLVEGQNGGGGGQPSIGQALKDALADGPSWAKSQFDETARGNSLRMLGNVSQANWQANDFKVAYLAQDNPSNISLNFLKKDDGATHINNLPFTNFEALVASHTLDPTRLTPADLPANASKRDNSNGDILLSGYHSMGFGRVNRQIQAVPLDPAPHLVSLNEFKVANQITNPGTVAHMVVPPNSFMNGAISLDDRKTGRNVHMLAAAMAGTNQKPFDVQMPYGYIVLDNSAYRHFSGVVPNANNVFAQELGMGIDVDAQSKYFNLPKHSDAEQPDYQVRRWHETPRDPVSDGTGTRPFDPSRDGPAWDKIYDNAGELARSAQQVADHVPYHSGGSNAIQCNHSNSDRHSPTPVPACVQLAEPGNNPSGMSPFDWAYHRGEDQSFGSSGTFNTDTLTATEQTGCELISTWEKATHNLIPAPYHGNFNIQTTGIGLYPQGHNPIQGQAAPWAKPGKGFNQNIPPGADGYSNNQQCKVTTAGTLAQLVDQTSGYVPDPDPVAPSAQSPVARAIEKIVKQRMHEMLPADDATINGEYNATVKAKKLDIGKINYLYLDPAQNYKKFKITESNSPLQPYTNTPPWVNRGTLKNHVLTTDGKPSKVLETEYGVAMTMADVKNQWGIHDTPFVHINGHTVMAGQDLRETPGNGLIRATDEIIVTPNSGAFGNLLNITFHEKTTGDAGFTDRD